MTPRNESDALACYREMARNSVAGLARAPWDERDDADALDAADAREAQRAIDDGESDAVSAAPKSAAEYRADARRYDAQRADAESAGDLLAADRYARRALLAWRAAEGAAFRALRAASKGGAQ